MSEAIELSKAVALRLTNASHAGELGAYSFIAKHSLLPELTLEELQSLSVYVRPRGDVRTFETRSTTRHDYPIEIAVRQHVGKPDSLVAEELVGVAEKIADYWRFLAGAPGVAFTGRTERLVADMSVEFGDEEIRSQRVIKNTITLTFRGWRT